jgi:hypothetical protein
MLAEIAIRALAVPRQAQFFRNVEYDRRQKNVVPAREVDQAFASFRLDVGGVDRNQTPSREAHTRDIMEHVERVFGCGLVIFVVRDDAAASV